MSIRKVRELIAGAEEQVAAARAAGVGIREALAARRAIRRLLRWAK